MLADDARAREVAKERGLVVVGTMGVLLGAKRRGFIPQVGPVMARMEGLGMFVSAKLRDAVLRLADEVEI